MEVLIVKIGKWLDQINPPCKKCPYKLGMIQTPVNPCPQCKVNDYKSYELFKKQVGK